MKALIATLSAAIAFSAPAHAGTIWDALSMTGSQRLYVYALSQPGMGEKPHAMRAKILKGMGFEGRVGEISSSAFRIKPVLRYDNNVNGGFPADSVTVAGMTFTINPDARRVSGLLTGISAQGGFAMPLADGLALSSKISAEYAGDFEHGLWKGRAQGEMCLNKMVSTSTWLDACAQAWYAGYALGDNRGVGASIAAHHDFRAGKSLNEVTVQLAHTQNAGRGMDGYDQQTLSVRMTSARASGIALFGGVDFGSKVEGSMVMRERVSFGLGGKVAGRPSSISISAQNLRGGLWLGAPRHDRVYTLSLSHQMTKKMGLSVSMTRTESSAGVFSGTVFGMNASIVF